MLNDIKNILNRCEGVDMALAKWIKWKKNEGPDIWEYNNGTHAYNPGIAILKKENKVIAKFFGPKNLSARIIVNHIKSVYPAENKLILHQTCDVTLRLNIFGVIIHLDVLYF